MPAGAGRPRSLYAALVVKIPFNMDDPVEAEMYALIAGKPKGFKGRTVLESWKNGFNATAPIVEIEKKTTFDMSKEFEQ